MFFCLLFHPTLCWAHFTPINYVLNVVGPLVENCSLAIIGLRPASPVSKLKLASDVSKTG